MAYILHQDDFDPGMRYEGLARYAFDCERWGGPNNVAQQSVYNSLFTPNTSEEGLLVLNQILDALINKNSNSSKEEFSNLKSSLSEGMKQRTAIELIDYIIQILSEN